MKVSILVCMCLSVVLLQGCITKVVTVPAKMAYKTTKGAVVGTAMVVGAVIPDGDDDEDEKDNDKDD